VPKKHKHLQITKKAVINSDGSLLFRSDITRIRFIDIDSNLHSLWSVGGFKQELGKGGRTVDFVNKFGDTYKNLI